MTPKPEEESEEHVGRGGWLQIEGGMQGERERERERESDRSRGRD